MELVVVDEVLVSTQERNVAVGIYIHCTDKVIGVHAISLGTQHILCRRSKSYTGIDVCCNAGSHALTTFCIDENYTIGCTCTIDGCTVLENLYVTYIVYVNCIEDIVVKTHVDRLVTLLHIPNDTVDNEQRLCIRVQRVDTADKHRVTDTGST